jgi:hypothetical protein
VKIELDVNPHLVLVTGTTELRKTFSSERLLGILTSYMRGLKLAFAPATAMAGTCFVMGVLAPQGNFRYVVNGDGAEGDGNGEK